MNVPTINRDELKIWLAEGREFVLIDTALEEDFAAQHLPHAKNACVFEVNFLAQVNALDGSRDLPVVVYGASEHSFASTDAAEKLFAGGFAKVFDYREGLSGWQEAGWPLEGSGQIRRVPPLEDRVYRIDPEKSSVEWVGRSLGGKHQGTIALLEGGTVTLGAGRLVEGNFTLDMTSIEDTDLADSVLKEMLHDHLKSVDFFDVANYPRAFFRLEHADIIAGVSVGEPNYRLSGKFTLKGIEKPLSFAAQTGHSPEGDGSLVARANFDLDRTEWNVRYGSGKFYERLGKHLVSDLITLDLKIVAR